MTVAPGDRLGPYEITAKLGEGGMGEVYRARDSRLERDVAIKVLPAAFVADPERLARFEREAKLLAQLNHPSIAQIYGMEASGEAHALVMELVEGPTLADRLAKGALPLDEGLSIAKQIAEALEEAHEKGIIHRDLKPQNVKASTEGKTKVLDFGLAKAMDPAGTGAASSGFDAARSPTLMQSPTLTAAHGTQLGVILGTAAYMAPEQARGGAVDKRADIWAFGVVLWEMLAGRSLFAGPTVSDTLAGVLKSEVDFGALPAATPPALRRLLRRCLERNPRNRLHDIADARLVLDDLARGEVEAPASRPGAAAGGSGAARRWVAGLGLLLLGTLVGLGVARLRGPAAAPAPDYHLLTLENGYIHSARFAPDGVTIVYGETRGGAPVALYSTRADATASRPLDVPGADVVGIAANGEMALLLDRHHVGSWMRVGTLARAALAGGAPRALLEGIYDADIGPDGSAFAIVRADGLGTRLEYPIGSVLYRTDGWISAPRIARDGRRIAFADHPIPGDDQGFVAIVETGREPRRLSDSLNFLHGIAWSADGREIFASYGSSDEGGYVTAFAMDGTRRELLRMVTSVRLHDVAPNGTILLTDDSFPISVEGRLAEGAARIAVGALTGATINGISEDGEVLVGTSGGLLEEGEYRSFYRRGAGGPEIDLGPGSAAGVSPDGRWAFLATRTRDRTRLRAVPTGPGEPRAYDLGEVEPQVHGTQDFLSFTADGRTAAFLGRRAGEGARGYLLDLAAAKPPRAVTPVGVHRVRLSPDGKSLVAADAGELLGLYETVGGQRQSIPGSVAGEIAVAWSAASDALFVWDRAIPARVERLDLATGQRTLALEWKPSGSAEGLYGLLTASTDARYFLMRFRGGLSSLLVARGAR